MLSLLLNTFIFPVIIACLFLGIHYLYLKFNNKDDEYTRNDFIMIFIKYYLVSLSTMMAHQYLRNYLQGKGSSSSTSTSTSSSTSPASSSSKNVMFGGANADISSSNSVSNKGVLNSSSTNPSSFKPVSNVANTPSTFPQPNYESFKTGRPTF